MAPLERDRSPVEAWLAEAWRHGEVVPDAAGGLTRLAAARPVPRPSGRHRSLARLVAPTKLAAMLACVARQTGVHSVRR